MTNDIQFWLLWDLYKKGLQPKQLHNSVVAVLNQFVQCDYRRTYDPVVSYEHWKGECLSWRSLVIQFSKWLNVVSKTMHTESEEAQRSS